MGATDAREKRPGVFLVDTDLWFDWAVASAISTGSSTTLPASVSRPSDPYDEIDRRVRELIDELGVGPQG
jgi:hypothetical protein